ncbi:hypothetical protein XELAEV_18022514mg [Xenopus laevis]|uniref:Uncharacterized protein n=1 Tax=Xenopus laevis TaxID=8355 RepID=A0A974HN96_XENLA|nr:hypothetical protein XELAEV_18022514mg [Xenopus laevis]
MEPRVTEEFIYQVLDGEQTFYRPRVAASRRYSAGVLLNVLIESPREIDCDRVPPDIDAESEGPWKIVLTDMSADADELTTQGEALTTQTRPEMDSLRIRQLKRGTLNSDSVAVTIRSHYQDKLPPGSVALMQRVRQEEVDAYARVRQSPTSGHTEKSPADAKLGNIQPNCPVPDEGETQSAFYKKKKSYYEPFICESDSPEEEKVLSREKTTVENPVGMKVWQVRTLLVYPRGECRGLEESFPCLSACKVEKAEKKLLNLGRFNPARPLPSCCKLRRRKVPLVRLILLQSCV